MQHIYVVCLFCQISPDSIEPIYLLFITRVEEVVKDDFRVKNSLNKQRSGKPEFLHVSFLVLMCDGSFFAEVARFQIQQNPLYIHPRKSFLSDAMITSDKYQISGIPENMHISFRQV
jgi:hypothetical protein